MRKEQIITTNNNQMEEKGMKSRFIHFKKRFVPALSGALMGVMLMSTTCFAAGTGTSAVTQPLENLKTLIIAVIGKKSRYVRHMANPRNSGTALFPVYSRLENFVVA